MYITIFTNAGIIDILAGIGTAGKINDTSIEVNSIDTVSVSFNFHQPVYSIQFGLNFISDLLEITDVLISLENC